MDAETALTLVNQVLETPLTDLQVLILRQSVSGQSYADMAAQAGYEVDYLKNVGSKLWKLLSRAIGESVTKSNIQSVLQRYQDRTVSRSQANALSNQQVNEQIEEQTDEQDKAALGDTAPTRPIPLPVIDWGEALDVTIFYGRQAELDCLYQWIVHDRCRLITVLGMGGIGKTSLTIKLAQSIAHSSSIDQSTLCTFDRVIWRSLQNAPPLDLLLDEILRFLSPELPSDYPISQRTSDRISSLIRILQTQRCLLILDNAETILRSGEWAGYYQSGYEDYGTLLKRIAEVPHQSCVLLTSREHPKNLESLHGVTLPVRLLRLSGLSDEAAHAILQSRGVIHGSKIDRQQLTQHYAGNPLALKMVATTIDELFDGNLSAFLDQGFTVFDDIRTLLDQQFSRLSSLEQNLMYWLAITREPMPLTYWQQTSLAPAKRANLLEAVQSLRRRSLIEKSHLLPTQLATETVIVGYTQQPVVMEYVIEQLLERICAEICITHPDLLTQHALLHATTKDYIRETQTRIILEPLLQRLSAILPSTAAIKQHLTAILQLLRCQQTVAGYAPGNLLNLFRLLQTDLTGYDFSGLPIWQAYLQDINLHQVNFAFTHITNTVFAHTLGSILSVAFSPNGQWLATSEADGVIRLWHVLDGQLLFASCEHHQWVWSIAFTPDSQSLISGSEDHTLKGWNTQTGQCHHEWQGHSHWVWSVAVCPLAFNPIADPHTADRAGQAVGDGLIASGSEDHTIRLWSRLTGRCLTIWQVGSAVYGVTFSPEGMTLASASGDHIIRLWDVSTGTCLQMLQGHTQRIRSIAFSPDGVLLASAGDDQTIRWWDRVSGQVVRIISHTSRLWSVAFSPDGCWCASGSDDAIVRLWEVATGSHISFQGHRSRVWSVAFSPNGALLASSSDDQTIRLWDVSTAQPLRTLQGSNAWIWTIAFSPDGTQLASGSESGAIRLWNYRTRQNIQVWQHQHHRLWSVVYSPDGQRLASGGEDHTVRLWDTGTGTCLKTFVGHTRQVRMVAFSPDGQWLASGSGDQTVKLWQVNTGQCWQTLRGHNGSILAVAFSADGRWLATASDDGTICLWDRHHALAPRSLAGHGAAVGAITFSPDAGWFASAGFDGTVRLWEMQQFRVQVYQGHRGRVATIAFSPDGHILASGGSDRTVYLWDLKTHTPLHHWEAHSKEITALAFHPHEATLATASEDETIQLWQFPTGQWLDTWRSTRPYEGLNIMGAQGLTSAQYAALKIMGAIEG